GIPRPSSFERTGWVERKRNPGAPVSHERAIGDFASLNRGDGLSLTGAGGSRGRRGRGAACAPARRLLRPLGAKGGRRRPLKGKAEDWQVFARMILVARQLRQAVVDRPRLLALVDRRIKVDVVPAGFPGRLHEDLNIALAVEAAGITAVAIVVDDRVDVGG